MATAQITVPTGSNFSFMKGPARATIFFPGMQLGGRDAELFIKILAMEFVDASNKSGCLPSKADVQFKNDSGKPMDARQFFQFIVNSRPMYGENYSLPDDRVNFLKTLFIFEGDTLRLRGELAEKVDAFALGQQLNEFVRRFGEKMLAEERIV